MPWKLVEEQPQQSSISDIAKEVVRHPARLAFNLGSRIAGTPGDIAQLLPKNDILGVAARTVLPTTEKIREKGYQRSQEYLKPQNKIESFIDDVVEDAALLLVPGTAPIKGIKAASPIMKGVKALGQSLGANIAKEFTEQVSGSEKAGVAAKLGSLFFLTLMGGPSAKKQIGALYQQAEELLPEGTKVSADILNKNLSNLEKKVTAGRPIENLAPSEKFAYDEIQNIKRLGESGEIDLRQLLAQKRSLNETLSSKKLFDLDKKGQHRARDLAKPLTGFIKDTVAQYGKANPQFYKLFKEADIGFGAIAQSSKISNFIEKHVKYNPMTVGLLHLFGSEIGATTAAGFLPYQAYKIGYQISKSPALRKIYANAIKSALEKDSMTFNKELAKLDQELQKDESKEQWQFVD